MSDIDIQAHLYRAFLGGNTADVALTVKGTWHAVYHLHRVVLIQSDFFKSLFTSGFRESADECEIDLVFDDYNITRPAFELCIARLYGGGPNLHVSPSLVPTRNNPLTPNFPKPSPREETPTGHHPATPRFLLSLLATSIYLSIPSIVSQCLHWIFNTIGPRTVISYLDFALGMPLQEPEEWEPKAAVGLESIACVVPETTSSPDDDVAAYSIIKDSNLDSPTETVSDSSPRPCANYGPISIKIGEAISCWLARWAPDTLALESGHSTELSALMSPITNRRPRSHTLPTTVHEQPQKEKRVLKEHLPVIWNRGGLSAQWVRALVSSDNLFVKGELERYQFARDVVELRRQGGILEEEEKEWHKIFAEGIYYSNMLTEDLLRISHDVSPTTGKPYVPLEILQSSLWDQATLRNTITARSSSVGASPRPESPSVVRDKELGIPFTTSEILNRISGSKDNGGKTTPYWRVPGDRSTRLGDAGSKEGATMDQLFEMGHHSSGKSSPPLVPSSEKNFFGLLPDRHTAASAVESDPTGKACWSPHPPFRFAVEFWDIDHLKEKSRLHSHTVFYAGSLYNVYVQVVKKKNIQLGVYLHRQSSVDLIPPSSIPSQLAPASPMQSSEPERAASPPPQSSRRPNNSPTIHYSPSIHPLSRSTTPHSASGSPSTPSLATATPQTLPALATPIAPVQPYRDPRPSVLAYFTISCASSIGYSMSKFSSAPDVFAVSQSWGWKSSTMHTEDYMDVTPPTEGSSRVRGKEVSLRVTVILGVV